MKARPCTYCGTMITMIQTLNKKWSPIEPQFQKRMGSAPLVKGKYYDEQGEIYDESEVPNGIKVWRAHWGDCPGAKEAKKKENLL